MKIRFALLASAASAMVLPCMMNAAMAADTMPAIPMFVTLQPHAQTKPHSPAAQLTQWNGGFTDLTNRKVTFTMIGTDPAKAGQTTTTTVVIVPIKMVYGANNGNMTFDPNVHTVANGNTVTADFIASPLFDPGVDFVQGGIDLGSTQYIDAFQRANFWGAKIKKKGASTYHVLLGTPTVLSEQTINVTAAQGKVGQEFGVTVGLMDINAFDTALNGFIAQFSQINPGVLPLFITYNVYLTSGGCCIGGYHNANGRQPGGQTYSYATYVDHVGAFSQDVSAWSHELGEWQDDPFIDNRVNCNDNSILEVGDPLEGHANFGGFPYVLNGSTYNLQSLVFLDYFGAPRKTDLKKWFSFQNDETHVCPGQ